MLPVGISFYTFTQIAFLVDAYRGLAREYDFIHYLLAGDPKIMASFFKASGYSKFTVRTSVDSALASDKNGLDGIIPPISR